MTSPSFVWWFDEPAHLKHLFRKTMQFPLNITEAFRISIKGLIYGASTLFPSISTTSFLFFLSRCLCRAWAVICLCSLIVIPPYPWLHVVYTSSFLYYNTKTEGVQIGGINTLDPCASCEWATRMIYGPSTQIIHAHNWRGIWMREYCIFLPAVFPPHVPCRYVRWRVRRLSWCHYVPWISLDREWLGLAGQLYCIHKLSTPPPAPPITLMGPILWSQLPCFQHQFKIWNNIWGW